MRITPRWTGVAASELLSKRVRNYDGVADRGQPRLLRRYVALSNPMYPVDDQDRVIELKDVPQPDIGAPAPVVLSDERTTLLAYATQRGTFSPDGRILTEADLAMFVEELALIEFRPCKSFMFGAPNDEAFDGQPLANRGLHPYGVFEIENSSWIRRLEQMNSVHPLHRGGYLQRLKHFVFVFHDSTFECVARSFAVSIHSGSFESLLPEMHKRLQWDPT